MLFDEIDISNINKAKLLITLYNNAKNSHWTINTVGSQYVLDSYFFYLYKEKIDSEIQQLQLSDEEAEKILHEKNGFIDYIGPVCIKINFSTNKLSNHALN